MGKVPGRARQWAALAGFVRPRRSPTKRALATSSGQRPGTWACRSGILSRIAAAYSSSSSANPQTSLTDPSRTVVLVGTDEQEVGAWRCSSERSSTGLTLNTARAHRVDQIHLLPSWSQRRLTGEGPALHNINKNVGAAEVEMPVAAGAAVAAADANLAAVGAGKESFAADWASAAVAHMTLKEVDLPGRIRQAGWGHVERSWGIFRLEAEIRDEDGCGFHEGPIAGGRVDDRAAAGCRGRLRAYRPDYASEPKCRWAGCTVAGDCEAVCLRGGEE